MNKSLLMGLTLILLAAGLLRVVTAVSSPKKIAQTESKLQNAPNVQGPFFGQDPEELKKTYEENLEESEEEKQAEKMAAQKKAKKKSDNTNQNEADTTKESAKENGKESKSPEEPPKEESGKPSSSTPPSPQEDFIRGY